MGINKLAIYDSDYKILRDLYSLSSKYIQDKLVQLSIWQSADISCSEINLNIIKQEKDNLYYVDEDNLCVALTKLHKGLAQSGTTVYITAASLTFGNEYIGRCFKIHTRFVGLNGHNYPVIKAYNTYSDNNQEYFIALDDEQYLILNDAF